MIRINLLGTEAGPQRPARAESHWISRRELWLGIVLLGAGMGVLFYMATRMPRPVQQPRAAQQPRTTLPQLPPTTGPDGNAGQPTPAIAGPQTAAGSQAASAPRNAAKPQAATGAQAAAAAPTDLGRSSEV